MYLKQQLNLFKGTAASEPYKGTALFEPYKGKAAIKPYKDKAATAPYKGGFLWTKPEFSHI